MTATLIRPVEETWTHTMAFDDVLGMIRVAEPGMSAISWRAAAARASRFPLPSQRNVQLRIATAILRPASTIEASPFLADVQAERRSACRDLVYGRYLRGHAVAGALARGLFVPRVRSHDARGIEAAEFDAFLVQALATASAASRSRTRSAAVTEFVRAGVLRGSLKTGLMVTGAPALHYKAFGDLLLDDLRRRGDATDTWVAAESTPAILFALAEEHVRRLLEAVVEAGIVRRSYYAGRPRVLAP